MTNSISLEQKNQLEALVDQSSVQYVLEALSEICWDKGDHIRSNWQDPHLALLWERAGNSISGFAAKTNITNLTFGA